MRSNLKILSGYIVLIIIAITDIHAQKVDVHIGIPITGNSLRIVKKTILSAQAQIKNAATENGYDLDTSMISSNNLHITLEYAKNVDEKDIYKYVNCVRSIAQSTEAFDLTDYFARGQFKQLGFIDWGVLSFPLSPDSDLYKLRRQIRKCCKLAGLKVSGFRVFDAHISLGKFEQRINNLDWVPHFEKILPEGSFVIKEIALTVRDRQTKTKRPARVFQLRRNPTFNTPQPSKPANSAPEATCVSPRLLSQQRKVEHHMNLAAPVTGPMRAQAFKPATIAHKVNLGISTAPTTNVLSVD